MLATLVFGQPVLASLVGALVALVGWAAWTLHLKTRLSPFYPLNGRSLLARCPILRPLV